MAQFRQTEDGEWQQLTEDGWVRIQYTPTVDQDSGQALTSYGPNTVINGQQVGDPWRFSDIRYGNGYRLTDAQIEDAKAKGFTSGDQYAHYGPGSAVWNMYGGVNANDPRFSDYVSRANAGGRAMAASQDDGEGWGGGLLNTVGQIAAAYFGGPIGAGLYATASSGGDIGKGLLAAGTTYLGGELLGGAGGYDAGAAMDAAVAQGAANAGAGALGSAALPLDQVGALSNATGAGGNMSWLDDVLGVTPGEGFSSAANLGYSPASSVTDALGATTGLESVLTGNSAAVAAASAPSWLSNLINQAAKDPLGTASNTLKAMGLLNAAGQPTASLTGMLGTAGNLAGGYLNTQAAKEAAQIQANAQIESAKIAAEAAKFKPVGVTTRFGQSNFGYDDKGNLTSAGYTLSPEMKGIQDRLMGAITGSQVAPNSAKPTNGSPITGGLFGGVKFTGGDVPPPPILQGTQKPFDDGSSGTRLNPDGTVETYGMGPPQISAFGGPPGIDGTPGGYQSGLPDIYGMGPPQMSAAGGGGMLSDGSQQQSIMDRINALTSMQAVKALPDGNFDATTAEGKARLAAMQSAQAVLQNDPQYQSLMNQYNAIASKGPITTSGGNQPSGVGGYDLLQQFIDSQAATAPMGTAAQRAMQLGQGYLATDPAAQAQKYMAEQQALLAPTRERQMASTLQGEFNRGTYGLGTGSTSTGMMAANPRLEALMNAQRQQDLGLAAQATQGGMDYAKFGAGMVGTGGDLLKSMYGTQTAAYAPYQTALGGVTTIEGLGQNALTQGISLGGNVTAANAAAGGLLAQGMTNAANTVGSTAQQAGSTWGNLLQGAGNWMNKQAAPAAGQTTGMMMYNPYTGQPIDWSK